MQFKYLFTALPLLHTTATAQLASVTWPSNLGRIRVYRVADNGRIQEYQWDSTGQWTGPSWIGAKAKPGSALTAVNSNDRVSLSSVLRMRHKNGTLTLRFGFSCVCTTLTATTNLASICMSLVRAGVLANSRGVLP